MTLINETREVQVRVTSFSGTVPMCPGEVNVVLKLSQRNSNYGDQTVESGSVGRGSGGKCLGLGKSYN